MEKLEYKYTAMNDAGSSLVRAMQTYKRYYGQEDEALAETCVASVIKQFELFYEMTWKYFKFYLSEKNGIETVGTRDIFRAMHDVKLINTGQLDVFLDCIKIRNATVHTYNKDYARALCKEIVKIYPDMKTIIDGIARTKIR